MEDVFNKIADAIKPKYKTVYGLRIRTNDNEDWSEPEYFKTRKQRDNAEKYARILAGFRTWRIEQKKTIEEIEELFD
jgi:hypothetical protein